MIEIIGAEIVAPEIKDRTLCQIAAEASCESKPIMPVSVTEPLFFVDRAWTPRVLRGLARISLMSPGAGAHGISQAHADYLIGDMSGDVEEFFTPILKRQT